MSLFTRTLGGAPEGSPHRTLLGKMQERHPERFPDEERGSGARKAKARGHAGSIRTGTGGLTSTAPLGTKSLIGA